MICAPMKCLFILVLLWRLGSATETLQAQVAGGSVSGVVTDPSGASIPRAKVVLRSLATQMVRTVNANGDGFYAAPNLVPADYELTVSSAGFETQVSRFTVTIGAEGELNFALRIGPVDQTIEVEGPAAGIGLGTSAPGALVNQRTIEDLPLNGRSWTDLAALQPGVLPIEAQPSYTAGNG